MHDLQDRLTDPPWRIGVDVGGTFTDVVVADTTGHMLITKSPSVPQDPAQGVILALSKAAEEAHSTLEDLLAGAATLVHGSTVATNIILEGKGARVGLLCTDGFRDALTVRRGIRADPWCHREPYPAPLVPRRLRLPLRGRIDHRGNEIEPLNLEDLEAAVRQFEASGVEAIAIALLHSYANPSHELAARDAIARVNPSIPVFPSCEVAPVIGEYIRTSTAAAAAAVAPRILPYLTALESRLAAVGLNAPLLLMQSNGGLVTVSEVVSNPACLLLSGPSGGVGGLRWLAEVTGERDFITMEMGGTSCDLILMHGGRIENTNTLDVAGYDVCVSAVDIHTVSAGGGSIARVDAGGVLSLGPDGAGSEPGPAAYGRGGQEATDTDAQLVLGRLPAGAFAGGAISLDPARAREAVDANIASRLGIDAIPAAAGICRLQEQTLIHAVERVSVERGYDPRQFTIVGVGGAAAVHAATVARHLGCQKVIVPRLAGVFCAFGMLNADLRRDAVRSFIRPLSDKSLVEADEMFEAMMSEIGSALARQLGDAGHAIFERAFEIRYAGQQSTLRIDYENNAAALLAVFENLHNELYGHLQPDATLEIAAVHLTGSIATPPIRAAIGTAATTPPTPCAFRTVWIEQDGTVDKVPIYRGDDLHPGHRLAGPLIVEEKTTTVLVNPGDELRVDAMGNLVVEIRVTEGAIMQREHEVETL